MMSRLISPSENTRYRASLFLSLRLFRHPSHKQPPPLAPDLRNKIDDIAHNVLRTTGVPSASLAIVKDGKIAYVQAYGDARLDPATPAQPRMRYSIGSISKQFTAAAILMLAEEGKLSLDDPVSKYVSGLTRGNEVTIRELLSHTSGYQDFWPQDYVPPLMLQPITADGIMDRWARKPLDFDPGTKWQYSNTNYVIAGVIVEKVAGMPLLQFLSQRIFTPLGMKSVADTNLNKLPPTDPTGYFRFALGPLHPAAERRQRLDVCCRRTRNDRRGPGNVGHLDDSGDGAQTVFLS